MSRIIFWDDGHGGSAEIAAASAVGMALTYPGRILLINEDQAGTSVDAGFSLSDEFRDRGNPPLEEYGIDALLRLASNQRLCAANFSDYTQPVIKGKLDLVSGTRNECSEYSSEAGEMLNRVYAAAEQAYEIIISRSRISSGAFVETKTNPLYMQTGRIKRVAVLRQNRLELERFFAGMDCETNWATVTDIIVLQHYDPRSHWSAGNIRRRFGCQLPMYSIPYSTEFMDAWNNMNILKCIRLHRLLPRRGPVKEEMLAGLAGLCDGLYRLSAERAADSRGSEMGA